LLVGFQRIGLAPKLLEGDAPAGPGLGVLVVDIERGVEVVDRRLVLAERQVALAARLVGRRREGVAVDGGAEIRDRGLLVALALADQATRMQSLGRFRGEADRLVEIGERLV